MKRNGSTKPAPDFSSTLEELKTIVPAGSNAHDLLAGLVDVIHRYLKPLPDQQENDNRTQAIIGRYCKAIQRRDPVKRPKTRPGVFKSISAFVTKDLRCAAQEFAVFEAKAENAIVDNPAMILTSDGVARHRERTLRIIDRFMLIIAGQWESLGSFKTRLHQLENQYYDRDNWSLQLHDRLNRLANLLTTVDSCITALKRALMNGKPHHHAVVALHALRDNSLNPLEFIKKVFANDEHECSISVHPPELPLTYSNHFIIREILIELVHNALDAGASAITITAKRVEQSLAHIDVVDDCPGGIPAEIRSRIGKERIATPPAGIDDLDLFGERQHVNGWGLYTVTNNLIPHLGSCASISFHSPLTTGGSTRVSLVVPIIDKTTIHRRRSATAFNPLCINPLAAGGTALVSDCIRAQIAWPN